MKKLLKQIYFRLPFKKKLFSFIKKFGTPSRSVYQHLYFNDNMDVRVDMERMFRIRHYGYQIENEIFWNGIFNGWEKVSLTIWSELCENAEVIVDIGANTGIYSLLAKTINQHAKVFSFDPVKRVYDKLCHNIELNNYDIKAIEKAVSDQDGFATIFDKDIEHTYSVTINEDRSTDSTNSIPVEVETIRLDTFIRSESLSRIDLIKIDVETHEPQVLKGFGELLYDFKPSLIIEILNDDVARQIEDIVRDIGYEYYVIDENSGVQQVQSLRKSDYFNFLICMPHISSRLKSVKEFSKSYKS